MVFTITLPITLTFTITIQQGLPYAHGYYDDDDRSTDEGMHRIKLGQYIFCLLPLLDCYGGYLFTITTTITIIYSIQ